MVLAVSASTASPLIGERFSRASISTPISKASWNSVTCGVRCGRSRRGNRSGRNCFLLPVSKRSQGLPGNGRAAPIPGPRTGAVFRRRWMLPDDALSQGP